MRHILAPSELSGASIGIVPADVSEAVANAAKLNAAMAALAGEGGGDIVLRDNIYVGGIAAGYATLDNRYSRVRLRGPGRDHMHDGGTATYGCRLIATTAHPLFAHRTPYGAGHAKHSGGGIEFITLDAGGIAPCLGIVDSVNGGAYDVTLLEAVGGLNSQAWLFKTGQSGVSGGTGLLEAADNQHFRARIVGRQIEAGADTPLVRMGDSQERNSNTSVSDDIYIAGQIKNGDGLDIVDGDNLDIRLSVFRVSGGTGKGFVCRGGVGNGHARGIRFTWYSGPDSEFEGVGARGVVTQPVTRCYVFTDAENGTPVPLVGVNAKAAIVTNDNVRIGFRDNKLVVANDLAGLSGAQGILGNHSLALWNANQAGIILGSNTPGGDVSWSWSIAPDGKLRLICSSGAVYTWNPV